MAKDRGGKGARTTSGLLNTQKCARTHAQNCPERERDTDATTAHAQTLAENDAQWPAHSASPPPFSLLRACWAPYHEYKPPRLPRLAEASALGQEALLLRKRRTRPRVLQRRHPGLPMCERCRQRNQVGGSSGQSKSSVLGSSESGFKDRQNPAPTTAHTHHSHHSTCRVRTTHPPTRATNQPTKKKRKKKIKPWYRRCLGAP